MSRCKVCGNEKSDEIKESKVFGNTKECEHCGTVYKIIDGKEYKLVDEHIK